MAKLEFHGKTYTNESDVSSLMAEFGIAYERWGIRAPTGAEDTAILNAYKPNINKLMTEGHYVSTDLVTLNPNTPNLPDIISKFDKEHHHLEDEVRFTVEGEGVFEICTVR